MRWALFTKCGFHSAEDGGPLRGLGGQYFRHKIGMFFARRKQSATTEGNGDQPSPNQPLQ